LSLALATAAKDDCGRVLSLSPLAPLPVPWAQDPGLSRIYLPESGPARATRADGLAGERTAGSGSKAL
jgi:hypothetical protein